ncbi:MAG: hypothetical protein DMF64_20785 [Acidobacteria bacterium]|nr:MAG: hypothetical protein DMF64_20785 [Acidobacteriota bacterium]
MNDWIGLVFIVLLVVGVVIASAKLGAPPRRLSEEEFEQRARDGSAGRAGLFALQQLLHPKAAKAVAVQQDLKHGYYNKKKIPGEGDDDELSLATPSAVDERMTEASNINAEDAEERDA